MQNLFSFVKTPHIIFGPGSFQSLIPEIKKIGNRALFIVGKQSFRKSNHGVLLNEQIHAHAISAYFESIETEPTPTDIDRICSIFRSKSIDVVIGIGGGSVLDAGKAVSAMLHINEGVKAFLEGVGSKIPSGIKIPFIAVSTTAGTGSETTSNAVLTEIGDNGFKRSLRHPDYVPNIAIVDPELTIGCSPALTAATGMDAFTQLVESFLSKKASTITDSLAIKAIALLYENIVAAVEQGDDIVARTAMSYASMVSGITLANAGLGTVHGFASSVGGCVAAPHGVICGTFMAICNEYTAKKLLNTEPTNIAIEKYAQLGKLLSKKGHKSKSFYIDYFINNLWELTNRLSIPKLGEFGLQEKHFEYILSETANKNNPVAFSPLELKEILAARV